MHKILQFTHQISEDLYLSIFLKTQIFFLLSCFIIENLNIRKDNKESPNDFLNKIRRKTKRFMLRTQINLMRFVTQSPNQHNQAPLHQSVQNHLHDQSARSRLLQDAQPGQWLLCLLNDHHSQRLNDQNLTVSR